jgi:hypothetical protein
LKKALREIKEIKEAIKEDEEFKDIINNLEFMLYRLDARLDDMNNKLSYILGILAVGMGLWIAILVTVV